MLFYCQRMTVEFRLRANVIQSDGRAHVFAVIPSPTVNIEAI